MLSAAVESADQIVQCLNTARRVAFIRQYAYLIHRLLYVQLQQEQWSYYYQVGMSENMWKGRVSKKWAKENSMCSKYGRSLTMVEQRRKKITQQLQQAENTLKEFEEQSLPTWILECNLPFDVRTISSVVTAFVRKGQYKLRRQFEQTRRMLILDSTDHRLVQAFYDLIPNPQQVCLFENSFTSMKDLFSALYCRFVQQNLFGSTHNIETKYVNKSKYSNIDCIQITYHQLTIFSIIPLTISSKCSPLFNLVLSIKIHGQYYLHVVERKLVNLNMTCSL